MYVQVDNVKSIDGYKKKEQIIRAYDLSNKVADNRLEIRKQIAQK